MNNRIDKKLNSLQEKKQKAFIAYITAGDPNLEITRELVFALERSGVDMIELGVPFSDPMADGPTIQAASQRALKNHVSLAMILDLVKHIRQTSQIPILLMTYYNPVFHMGDKAFISQAVQAGVDGVIIPDLPPEEAEVLRHEAKNNNFATVFFMAPTTTDSRLKMITNASTGFIYYVSLTGVTGARVELSTSIAKDIQRAKKVTNKPICVGFGISTQDHIRQVGRYADGVIVGSAIIKEMEKHVDNKELVVRTAAFVKSLVDALRKV